MRIKSLVVLWLIGGMSIVFLTYVFLIFVKLARVYEGTFSVVSLLFIGILGPLLVGAILVSLSDKTGIVDMEEIIR